MTPDEEALARRALIRNAAQRKQQADDAQRAAQNNWAQLLTDLYHEALLTPAEIYSTADIHKNTLVLIRKTNPTTQAAAHERITDRLNTTPTPAPAPAPAPGFFQEAVS